MYGLGFLAVVLFPFLTSAAPAPQGDDDWQYCCTITTKQDYPDKNPNEYFKVPCAGFRGQFHDTTRDDFNRVWRAECHNAYLDILDPLHQTPLGVINVDCKDGADACDMTVSFQASHLAFHRTVTV
ncbi:hypothetical protein IWX90DRAFT_490009 [Phyllosticta citrichinensis]|uniref:Uncharacterized protein n=1 Tax=Phyllosticta citrichinensis TaxID=1130410 RepID=A0ABR1XH85_9PEZI